MLSTDLCDTTKHMLMSKEILLLKEIIIKLKKNRSLAFKNNAPFTSCISKVNSVLLENSGDLDVVSPLYNFLKYSKSY